MLIGINKFFILRDIHYAVQHLVRPNQLFADAVDVRQVSVNNSLFFHIYLLTLIIFLHFVIQLF